jgi:hypothetical protein
MFDREMLTETVVPKLLSRGTLEQQGSYMYGLLIATEYNALSDAVDALEAAAIITENNAEVSDKYLVAMDLLLKWIECRADADKIPTEKRHWRKASPIQP